MADISQITLPSGTTYDLKDATARNLIDTLSSYSSYLGVTTTALTDGATTTPVTIDGSSVTPVVGSIVNYGSAEFIYNGTAWQEFGDLSALGDLAYKNTASGSVTATGSVSQPTFTGSAVAFTPAGTVTVASYTPAGTVSAPTFTGSEASYTPEGSVTVASYTPAGTVSAPTITTTPTTSSMYSMTGVGTLPSCTLPALACTVSDENLTLSWTDGSFDAGTLPTRGTATAVVTSVSATASAPTFTGTAKAPTATFSGTEGSITAAGTVSKPTFTGSAVTVTVS
ncbi:MAG: hypothetical protein LIO71_03470 [Ruminococcus sp.]|nr:hypothetical protein [Ruminococcus sp.]